MHDTMTVTVSRCRAYALAKQAIEARVMRVRVQEPWRHAGDLAGEVLQASPALWRTYQSGIAAGLPAEFQHVRRATPADRAWLRVERQARRVVAESATPLTLRQAVLMMARRPSRKRHART